MAKELPYFQFEPAEYLTKDISFCSLSAQGLFINICAFYWQRQCRLTKDQILRRFNYPDVLKELIDEKIIKYDEENNIVISFLLTQYNEIINKKSSDSEKGKIGNLKRWHKDVYEKFEKKEISLDEALEIAKTSGGDNLAIAETSQIREDKIKEDKINKSLLSEIEISDVEEENLKLYLTVAKNFQEIIIKNLEDRGVSTSVVKKAKVKGWVTPIKLMLENEECSLDDLRDVIRFLRSPKGNFWVANILSTDKLRKQITTLMLKIKQ